MKKQLFAAFAGIACLTILCSYSSIAQSPSGNMAQAKRNLANTIAVNKGIESGDLSVMDKFVAEDCVDHSGGPGGDVVGRDAIKKKLADIHNHFSNLKMEVISDATSASGEYHFALTRFSGTTTDNSMGSPANTPLNELSVEVVRIVHGMAKEHWSYVNMKDMMKMMEGMQNK